MGRWIVIGGGSLVAAAAGLALFLLVILRTGWDPGLTAIRRFNRRFMNQRAMKTAGQPGAYSIVRHVGRNTATPYETPVGVTETDDGAFLIALPYRTSADWLKNVRVAGAAELVHDGRVIPVRDPELVREEATEDASLWNRLGRLLFGVDLHLRLSRVVAQGGEGR